MPDLKEIQNDLRQVRRDKNAAQGAHFAASETLKRVQRELSQLERIAGANNADYLRRKAELLDLSKNLQVELGRQSHELQKNLTLEGIHWEALLPFSDPRTQVNRLPDHTPFLLFPLRLETRFKKIRQPDGQEQDQLWVRIYPDDCMVDNFEELLSESELRSARIFWQEWWKAGGHEAQQRGAWAGMVAAHGSGRAAWISGKSTLQPTTAEGASALQKIYRPLNAEPAKINPEDILLVATIETDDVTTLPFSAAEETALKTYWRALWLADGDAVQENSALEAFSGSVGAARAAELPEIYQPFNLKDRPKNGLPKSAVNVAVETLLLPKTDTMATRAHSWSRAPQVYVLPERFVLLAYVGDDVVINELGAPVPNPLVVGPNPNAPKPEQDAPEDAFDAVLIPEIRWMTDFKEAIRVGMGFRVDLSPESAQRGFDRLLVVGLQMGANAAEGRHLLEGLLQHHQYSSKGLGLLPQGAATNNTESQNAAFSRADDPDESFDLYFEKNTPPAPPPGDPLLMMRDGEWLSKWLGLGTDTFARTLYARGADQCEARAMNTALWPVTLGYLMDSMMQEVFDASDVEWTRHFFTRYVSGRGPVPALRIGRQPYGILPVSDFRNMSWFNQEAQFERSTWFSYLGRLHGVLNNLTGEWEVMKERADWVSKKQNSDGMPVDAHQALLNIVGLHPASVEFYQRYTPGRDFWWNYLLISGFYNYFRFTLPGSRSDLPETPDMAEGLDDGGMNFLRLMGYSGTKEPAILDKIFIRWATRMQGPLIDDRPLSETESIRNYTVPVSPETTGNNYIQWLIDHAQSPEILRKQEGFMENQPPAALLYLMLHQAMIEGYFDAGLRAHGQFEFADTVALRSAKIDRPFIHVQQPATFFAEAVASVPESKYEWLYTPVKSLDNQLMINHLASRIFTEDPPTRFISEQIKALAYLKDTPTARLERVFAEHIDTCSYRLDAWKTGLAHAQMEQMRTARQSDGICLGAFGWLENVRSENKVLSEPRLSGDLEETFQKNEPTSLFTDNTNGGYILAPSLNQAVTAAVLRNGYLSNATPANPQTLAVNLSSERVRMATGILEGIRNGQPLGALLGYQLERGLHNRYNESTGFSVDEVIYDLRLAFPLYGGQLAGSEDDDPEESVEANNVINGLDLTNHIKSHINNQGYPFRKSSLPTALSGAQVDAINEEVDRMLNLHDAVADLVMAESVYQVTLGNYDRAASTLDAFSKAGFPPEPQVVQTPRTGVALTHRVGLHLNPIAVAPAGATPRAVLEPALNEWLRSRLPAMNAIGCVTCYFDAASGNEKEPLFVTAQDLQLQPIDLLYLLNQSLFTPSTDLQAQTESSTDTASRRAFAELDDRIEYFIRQKPTARPDGEIRIMYTDKGNAGQISFFETAALVKSLRAILLTSRTLRPADLSLPEEASDANNTQAGFAPDRITALREIIDVTLPGLRTGFLHVSTHLRDLRGLEKLIVDVEKNIALPLAGDDVEALKTQLQNLKNQVQSLKQTITDDSDTLTGQIIPLLSAAGKYGFPDTGIGIIYAERKRIIRALRQKSADYKLRWDEKLLQFDLTITAFEAIKADMTIPESQKIDLLRKAERQLSTGFVPGNTVAELEVPVKAKRALFLPKMGELQALLDATPVSPLTEKNGLDTFKITAGDFDLLALDIQPESNQIHIYAQDLLIRADLLAKHLDENEEKSLLKKLKEAFGKIAEAADPEKKVQLATATAQLLLGEDFRMIPTYEMPAVLSAAWENANNASESLLDFQKNTMGNDFPEDDWLHGIARVREKMWHWENIALLSPGLELAELPLQALQFPGKPNDRWLALQYRIETDTDFKTPEHDHLLYTPHYGAPIDTTKVCGFLIDEWTEVIPQKEETLGLSFHFDRPNTEPPQTWLMVLPTDLRGQWQWNDLIGALLDTLSEAKRRAVEPAFIDDTALARFLPATMAAVTTYPITIQMNYAANNQFYKLITEENNG